MEHLKTYFNEVKEIVDKLDFDSLRGSCQNYQISKIGKADYLFWGLVAALEMPPMQLTTLESFAEFKPTPPLTMSQN